MFIFPLFYIGEKREKMKNARSQLKRTGLKLSIMSVILFTILLYTKES